MHCHYSMVININFSVTDLYFEATKHTFFCAGRAFQGGQTHCNGDIGTGFFYSKSGKYVINQIPNCTYM